MFARLSVLSLLVVAASAHAGHGHDHGHDHSHHDEHGRHLQSKRKCGTKDLSKEEIAIAQETMQAWTDANPYFEESTVNIEVYWHQILDGDGSGGISSSQISDSITVLNENFASAGYSFTLVDTTSTSNSAWYSHVFGSAEANDMRSSTRKGNEATLNIWSCNPQDDDPDGGTLLGYATFPNEYQSAPDIDGVVILQETVPGGSSPGTNEGITLVHEVGHWLFLFHVFGDCEGDIDEVADTAPQLEQTSGCPDTAPDTCPGDAFRDNINNYMDYSDDECLTEFTPGQISRMSSAWNTYRASGVEESDDCTPAPCPVAIANFFSKMAAPMISVMSKTSCFTFGYGC